jgi:hypothetical protein
MLHGRWRLPRTELLYEHANYGSGGLGTGIPQVVLLIPCYAEGESETLEVFKRSA